MPQSITTFLMFEGRAEEAMRFYTSLIPKSEIVQMSTYGPEGPGKEGSVIHAIFTLNGVPVMASDSPVQHAFGFTPSTSFFIQCALWCAFGTWLAWHYYTRPGAEAPS